MMMMTMINHESQVQRNLVPVNQVDLALNQAQTGQAKASQG